MGKKFFILNTDKKGSGVAKLYSFKGKMCLSLDVKNYTPLRKNEVFKGYILDGSRFSPIGSMETSKESFNVNKDFLVEGIVICRKNLENKTEEIEFWGGPSNIKTLAETKLFNKEPAEPVNAEVEIKEIPVIESIDKNVHSEIENVNPAVFTFDNFFGGGFDWQSVSGYYSLYNYTIVKHIMAGRNVYESINYFGFYYSGIKEIDDVTYIATAIPVRTGFLGPFQDFKDSVYTIEDERYLFDVICIGIDKKGEFFVEL